MLDCSGMRRTYEGGPDGLAMGKRPCKGIEWPDIAFGMILFASVLMLKEASRAEQDKCRRMTSRKLNFWIFRNARQSHSMLKSIIHVW